MDALRTMYTHVSQGHFHSNINPIYCQGRTWKPLYRSSSFTNLWHTILCTIHNFRYIPTNRPISPQHSSFFTYIFPFCPHLTHTPHFLPFLQGLFHLPEAYKQQRENRANISVSKICTSFHRKTGVLFSLRVKIPLRKQKTLSSESGFPMKAKGENKDEQL